MTREARMVRAILGRDRASVLDTDAYKLSMAQAGFPLRRESFYMTFRRDGLWYNPFDLAEIIRRFRPGHPDLKERGFLQAWGYGLTPAMEKALDAEMDIYAVPQGQWFGPKEPIIRVTSSSFLASWLEPLALMLHYPLQLATAMKQGERTFTVTCDDEAEIVRIVWEAVELSGSPRIEVRADDYVEEVRTNLHDITFVLQGMLERAFEVGMRAATCIQQHRQVLYACKEIGLERTSNLQLAYELNLVPVGTTGHEHQMRFASDADAFRAIRDTRPETPSYLFDTYDPMEIGIPSVMEVVLEDPDQRFSVRFDSGDQDAQFEKLWSFIKSHAPHAAFIFEDGYDARKTMHNENFLVERGFPLDRAWYGYGGYLVARPAFTPLVRDKVSAAWKLCETAGEGRMKFSGSPGKQSLPGRLVTFIRVDDPTDRLIGQAGETPPEGYDLFTKEVATTPEETTPHISPRTRKMVKEITAHREDLYRRYRHARR